MNMLFFGRKKYPDHMAHQRRQRWRSSPSAAGNFRSAGIRTACHLNIGRTMEQVQDIFEKPV
jgi:hypothetical protein